MFSEAKNLWQSASIALNVINENISSALEKIDLEVSANISSKETPIIAESDDELENETTAYKELLQETQLNQVEISNQFRKILLEKDFEINEYRKLLSEHSIQLPDGSHSLIALNSNDNKADVDVLLLERNSYELALKNLQEELQQCLSSQANAKVLQLKNNQNLAKIKDLTAEVTSLKEANATLEKQKQQLKEEFSSEIEELVLEYSKLAADSEVNLNNSALVEAKLRQDNEVLGTVILLCDIDMLHTYRRRV